MRVRIVQTVEVGDDYRRAIRLHYGRDGLATRAEVRDWIIGHGSAEDDDLMYALQKDDEARDEADDV